MSETVTHLSRRCPRCGRHLPPDAPEGLCAPCLLTAGVETLKVCFEQLYSEGAASGRIMNLGLHPHVIGQPHRIGALREFIDHAAARKDVWFPSREELAAWYLEHSESHIPSRAW